MEQFKCNVCSKILKKKYNLKEHLKTHSSNRLLFECCVCAKSFTRMTNLRAHFNSQHPNEEIKCVSKSSEVDSSIGFECFMCKKRFTKRHNLRSHMKIHSDYDEARKFHCELCDAMCANRFNLKRHVNQFYSTQSVQPMKPIPRTSAIIGTPTKPETQIKCRLVESRTFFSALGLKQVARRKRKSRLLEEEKLLINTFLYNKMKNGNCIFEKKR